MFWLGLALGFIFGVYFGLFLLGLCRAAAKESPEPENKNDE